MLIRDPDGEHPGRNPWGITFMAMFHMSNDSHLFEDDDGDEHLPLYEAKMIHQFDHRWATYHRENGDPPVVKDVPLADKQDPNFSVTPRYWVRQRHVLARIARVPRALARAYGAEDGHGVVAALANWIETGRTPEKALESPHESLQTLIALGGEHFALLSPDPKDWRNLKVQTEARNYAPLSAEELAALRKNSDLWSAMDALMDERSPRWLMGFRDIARSTDERTVIASILPRAAVGNNLPLMIFERFESPEYVAALIGNLSSLTLDYIARHKVGGTHLNFFIAKQLPVIAPDQYTSKDLSFISSRTLELIFSSYDLSAWAEDLGYKRTPFGFDPDRRAQVRAELDAYYARLYGLTREELAYILDPAEVMGPDYPSETFRVLKNNEEKTFGEYRTRRLILSAWDALERGELP